LTPPFLFLLFLSSQGLPSLYRNESVFHVSTSSSYMCHLALLPFVLDPPFQKKLLNSPLHAVVCLAASRRCLLVSYCSALSQVRRHTFTREDTKERIARTGPNTPSIRRRWRLANVMSWSIYLRSQRLVNAMSRSIYLRSQALCLIALHTHVLFFCSLCS
jgi:hypothetical protein